MAGAACLDAADPAVWFRPFFFLAALYAGAAIPVWLWLYFSGSLAGTVPRPALARPRNAVRLPAGRPCRLRSHRDPELDGPIAAERMALAGLVILWLAGRLLALPPGPFAAMASTSRSRSCLALQSGARSWRGALEERPVAVMITLFGLANAWTMQPISASFP